MTGGEAAPRSFVAQAHVDGQLMITEAGETRLTAPALVRYISNELCERIGMRADMIEIFVRLGAPPRPQR
jgi:hypothetical protein